MGFVLSREELARLKNHFAKGYLLGDTTMVMALFRTKPEVIKRVLPPPLKPTAAPTGTVYVAEFHTTNFGPPYNEAAVFLSCEYKGVVGNYCLSMPVTRDNAMWGGREVYGFPKKLADTINVKREGKTVIGTCIRRGAQLVQLRVQLTGAPAPSLPNVPNYLVKAFPSTTFEGFDAPPLLIRQANKIDWGTPEVGQGELKFGTSKLDYLHEIPVEEVLLAGYTKGMQIWMQPGEVLAKLNPAEYQPYVALREDSPF